MSTDWFSQYLAGYQSDPWQELNLWLWRRSMLKDGVPRNIFDSDDPVLAETLKLVDVAVRDQVRTINKYLLAKGMPNLAKLSDPPTPGMPYSVPSVKKRRKERCGRCGHINFTASCGCSCHQS